VLRPRPVGDGEDGKPRDVGKQRGREKICNEVADHRAGYGQRSGNPSALGSVREVSRARATRKPTTAQVNVTTNPKTSAQPWPGISWIMSRPYPLAYGHIRAGRWGAVLPFVITTLHSNGTPPHTHPEFAQPGMTDASPTTSGRA
jgi:hypothetical protein